jgi:hypothetical protein
MNKLQKIKAFIMCFIITIIIMVAWSHLIGLNDEIANYVINNLFEAILMVLIAFIVIVTIFIKTELSE